jgi:hypothetical protein
VSVPEPLVQHKQLREGKPKAANHEQALKGHKEPEGNLKGGAFCYGLNILLAPVALAAI